VPYVNITEENITGSLEEDTNENECLRMNSDEPVEGNHIFNVNTGEILTRNNVRSHEFTLESVILHVECGKCALEIRAALPP